MSKAEDFGELMTRTAHIISNPRRLEMLAEYMVTHPHTTEERKRGDLDVVFMKFEDNSMIGLEEIIYQAIVLTAITIGTNNVK